MVALPLLLLGTILVSGTKSIAQTSMGDTDRPTWATSDRPGGRIVPPSADPQGAVYVADPNESYERGKGHERNQP